jgi:hypothetical protein
MSVTPMPDLQSLAELPSIPLVDIRRGGPPEHARLRRAAMLELRDACLSLVPGPLKGVVKPLDTISSSWLRRSPSPYIRELEEIAAIAGRPGVWLVNASYEWGCTTRVDAAGAPSLWRTLDWPFRGLGRHVEIALQEGPAGPFYNVTWPGAAGALTALAPGRFAAAIPYSGAAVRPPFFRPTSCSTASPHGASPTAGPPRISCGTPSRRAAASMKRSSFSNEHPWPNQCCSRSPASGRGKAA